MKSAIHSLPTLVPLLCGILLAACDRGGPPGAMGPMGGMRGGAPVAVVATPVETRPYTDQFTALGTARSNESIEVTSRISSIVTRIAFTEGQQVVAGDLLVELDNRELEATLAKARASLSKINSQLERRRSLAATRVISESELEELEAEAMIAAAEVRVAEERWRDSFVRAPFAGTVGLRSVSLGALVGPDTLITTLDDLETLKLEFTVPEAFIAALTEGMAILASSSVYPEREFAGTVRTVDPRVDPVTRSVMVLAELPNRERLLRPGMFLTVNLQRQRDDVLLIPEQALMPRQGRQYVFVIKDGKAIEREVELGVRAPGLAEIRRGLSSGEVVITEGTQKLRSGSDVQIASSIS